MWKGRKFMTLSKKQNEKLISFYYNNYLEVA